MKRALILVVLLVLPMTAYARRTPARPMHVGSSLMTVAANSTPQDIPPPMADKVRLLSAPGQAGAMVWEIPMTRASALPRWDLDVAAPPLSMMDATQLARTWLTQRNPEVQRFLMQQVMLYRVGLGFWYYTFFFVAPSGQPGVPLPFRAVVLPDGSIVEPT